MRQAGRPGIKKQQEVRDAIARSMGYRDHAEVMEARKANGGKPVSRKS